MPTSGITGRRNLIGYPSPNPSRTVVETLSQGGQGSALRKEGNPIPVHWHQVKEVGRLRHPRLEAWGYENCL
jgi:hypothetical protein